jgi:hypothetical protein
VISGAGASSRFQSRYRAIRHRAGQRLGIASARWSPRLTLGFVYLLVAAAAFNGYYAKRGFQDDSRYISARQIMDGTAIRPFVFRRLDPMIANAVADAAPNSLRQGIWQRYVRGGISTLAPVVATTGGPRYFLAYTTLYYLVFFQFLVSLFALRAVFGRFVGPSAATIAPALWALLMPVIQAVSAGLFYDYTELLFLSCAVLAALDGRLALLALCTVLGTLNKETFLVFIPTLIPFLHPQMRLPRLVAATGGLMAISALIYAATRHAYASNGGFNADANWHDNLRFYPDPRNLLKFEKAYGLMLPRVWSVFGIAAGAAIASTVWRRVDRRLKGHLAIATVINLPLFLLFGAPAEVRNLSLCFVGFASLIAYAIDDWISHAEPASNQQ